MMKIKAFQRSVYGIFTELLYAFCLLGAGLLIAFLFTLKP